MSKLAMPQMARAGQGARIKKKHHDERAAELARQKITVRCAHCPTHGAGRGFKFTGPVLEARARFAEHRATAHPELPALEVAKAGQRKLQRQVPSLSRTSGGYRSRRDLVAPEELLRREVLRREARNDLPPLDAEEAAA